MAKMMKCLTVAGFLFFVLFAIMNLSFQNSLLLTMTITFATITYHLGMRLIVGYLVNRVMNNKADYTQKWYQLHKIEYRIYEAIKVKRWKNKMPSYDPDLFSPLKHTWSEIAQASCQAEVVHEIIIIFSFLPVLAFEIFGDFWVFFITSVCAALFDLIFVIMQRYNRPRLIKLAMKESQNRG